MDKLIPDPPLETTTPLEEILRAEDQARNREAIKRALDFYLCPNPVKPRQPSTMFLVNPSVDTESLLAHACESLASASAATSNFANELSGTQRSTVLGIQQVVMLAELAVNRALDRVDPQT
ncbi:hypothetical protein PHLH6_06940 [Pseudomonas sp. Seg1]|jgi:hypothetical protein|uniref:DUF6124 family protein n=1 Tax=unclassified Pseudomonas TaxID=196821 RepID=UPI000CD191DD|nr:MULTISPECIES: DUF6124 family protein [unclassified Pseudomonas]POA44797.1 hypothetical protein C1893_24990 [Pseudomonas sp. MPR-ANC1]BBP68690.1 hypothetical protein PHLH6_06940 [Pseudomonas sp. Seg1]